MSLLSNDKTIIDLLNAQTQAIGTLSTTLTDFIANEEDTDVSALKDSIDSLVTSTDAIKTAIGVEGGDTVGNDTNA